MNSRTFCHLLVSAQPICTSFKYKQYLGFPCASDSDIVAKNIVFHPTCPTTFLVVYIRCYQDDGKWTSSIIYIPDLNVSYLFPPNRSTYLFYFLNIRELNYFAFIFNDVAEKDIEPSPNSGNFSYCGFPCLAERWRITPTTSYISDPISPFFRSAGAYEVGPSAY